MDDTMLFIREHRDDDVMRLALQQKQYPDVDIAFALRQIEGYQTARRKLPQIAALEDWHYPRHLSLEQCSSDATADYKTRRLAAVARRLFGTDSVDLTEGMSVDTTGGMSVDTTGGTSVNTTEDMSIDTTEDMSIDTLVDLTGGMGIDTMALSRLARHTTYVEHDEELCRLARHNFPIAHCHIDVVCSDATDYLGTLTHVNCLYLDPARRNSSGHKVFRLQDAEPDITTLYPTLIAKADILMLKLSPMLDLTDALRHLPHAREVDLVAVKGELKEILITCCHQQPPRHLEEQPPRHPDISSSRHLDITADNTSLETPVVTIHCVNLDTDQPEFCFTMTTSRNPHTIQQSEITNPLTYLYEPNAAIMKAACFELLARRYHLAALDNNSHLFVAERLIADFPGRIFCLEGQADKHTLTGQARSVIARNHPLSADQLRQRFRLRESDTDFLIATRINRKPTLLLAHRI